MARAFFCSVRVRVRVLCATLTVDKLARLDSDSKYISPCFSSFSILV